MSAVAERPAYWPVPIVRAIPAVAVGLFITFAANHSPQTGLIAFGSFSVVTGAVLGWSTRRLTDRVLRGIAALQGIVAIVVGAVALVLSTGGLGLLLFLFTAFAAVTGFLELYSGLRARGAHPASRDWLVVGGFTAFSALVFLLLPLDSVQAVGLFGAYGILVGLFLAIAGFSLKWIGQDSPGYHDVIVDASAASETAAPETAASETAAPQSTESRG